MISRIRAAACAATLLLASTTAVHAAPLYTVDFLPDGFRGTRLNDLGQVVGAAGGIAALYSAGTVTTVAPAPSDGAGINNQGDVTGFLTPYNAAFTNIGGTFVDISGIVAGPNIESFGIAINDQGAVGGNIYVGGEHTRGFIYQNGVVDEIGTFGGDYSPLTALNNHGAATGYAAFAGPAGGYFHAYIYQDGTLQDLGTLSGSAPGVNSFGSDINDLGQVAGWSGSRPVLYSAGTMIDLSSPETYAGAAQALNDAGVVVGYAVFSPAPGEPDWHAFVYDGAALVDLNTLVDAPAGWQLTTAMDINDAGQILGTACQAGSCASVLLTPVPEPAAGFLLLAGLGVLAARGARCGRAASVATHCVLDTGDASEPFGAGRQA